jgi:hypothetical protein
MLDWEVDEMGREREPHNCEDKTSNKKSETRCLLGRKKIRVKKCMCVELLTWKEWPKL